MLEQTLLSRTVELFVVFVVDLSMARIRRTLYAIVFVEITYTLIWISTIFE